MTRIQAGTLATLRGANGSKSRQSVAAPPVGFLLTGAIIGAGVVRGWATTRSDMAGHHCGRIGRDTGRVMFGDEMAGSQQCAHCQHDDQQPVLARLGIRCGFHFDLHSGGFVWRHTASRGPPAATGIGPRYFPVEPARHSHRVSWPVPGHRSAQSPLPLSPLGPAPQAYAELIVLTPGVRSSWESLHIRIFARCNTFRCCLAALQASLPAVILYHGARVLWLLNGGSLGSEPVLDLLGQLARLSLNQQARLFRAATMLDLET